MRSSVFDFWNSFGDLETEVNDLRGRNLELEESIGRLCESPFIDNAFKSEREHMDLRKFKKDSKHQHVQIGKYKNRRIEQCSCNYQLCHYTRL